MLARHYFNGDGVLQDFILANMWANLTAGPTAQTWIIYPCPHELGGCMPLVRCEPGQVAILQPNVSVEPAVNGRGLHGSYR
jgi:hypothetical protein